MYDRSPPGTNRLSARQLEVLELVAKGRSNDEIGGLLSISPATVRTHVTAILATLGVSNRTEAAAAFYSWSARPDRVAALLARPAITVLPLVALDADNARAILLAGAIASDLSSLFARWCWFPVIASAPAGLRDEGETSWTIGRRLGARFVVGGGLRVGSTAWRLQVRIEDTRDGACIWTERYDFVPSAVFGVEDSICNAIVASAYPVLVAHIAAQASPPPAQGPWQIAHAAMALQHCLASGTGAAGAAGGNRSAGTLRGAPEHAANAPVTAINDPRVLHAAPMGASVAEKHPMEIGVRVSDDRRSRALRGARESGSTSSKSGTTSSKSAS